MKVLFASEDKNPILKSYLHAISERVELVNSVSSFWSSTLKFDIIHIQWIEELLGWKIKDFSDIKRIEQRLIFWRSMGSKIVVSNHNEVPHTPNDFNQILYSTVYMLVDGIIHLGNYSKNKLAGLYNNYVVHTVIPHPNYIDTLENNINKHSAKNKLNIADDKFVFMIFGMIRHKYEQEYLLNAIKNSRVSKSSVFVFSKPLFKYEKVGWKVHLYKRIKYEVNRLVMLFKYRNIVFYDKKIPDNDIQVLMNASDVVIIPRLNTLNSGVVYLAFSFRKIVIGPESGNISEVIREYDNFIFDPNDYNSLSNIIADLEKKNLAEIGEKNYNNILINNNSSKIGDLLILFYKDLTTVK